MELKRFLVLALGIFVLAIISEAPAQKTKKEPPDLKVQRYELEGNFGRGIMVDPEKKLEIEIVSRLQDGSPSQGKFALYRGEGSTKAIYKEVKYVIEAGKSNFWRFSAAEGINYVDISNLSGKIRVRVVQPRFDIPKAPVKETTSEMIYQLNSAIYLGAFQVAKEMLAKGVEINAQDRGGNTPLFMACRNGDVDFAKFLLSRGADPKIKNVTGGTALIAAASNKDGFKSLIPLLVKSGADVRAKAKDGTTVLWPLVTLLGRAEEGDIVDMLQLVLSQGAEVDPKIEGGFTPLMYAAREGNLGMVKLLVEKGADANARSKKGDTPRKLAKDSGHQKVVKFLKAKIK